MKKNVIISAIVIITLALVLFLPIPQGTCGDGGTRVYSALTYKIVVWNKISKNTYVPVGSPSSQIFSKTSVFWYPNNKNSIDDLWIMENYGSYGPISEYLIEKNDNLYLILPISESKVEIPNSYLNDLDNIDLNLLKSAEEKILDKIPRNSEEPYFYIVSNEGHLKLCAQVIVSIEPPAVSESESTDSGCGIDHEH